MMVATALFVATPTQAQSVKFGVKGGVNITKIEIEQGATAQSIYEMGKKNKSGWYIGPTLKVSFLGGLGVDCAALYDQRESEIDGFDVKQKFIYVPINLRFNIGLGGLGGLYLAAGPQFGFNIGDTDYEWGIKTLSSEGTSQINNTFQLKKSTFGVNVGAGIFLFKHLEVGAVYCIPLGNTADMDTDIIGIAQNVKDNVDVKHNTFQVSAALYF